MITALNIEHYWIMMIQIATFIFMMLIFKEIISIKSKIEREK